MRSREVIDYDFDDEFFDQCIAIGEQEIERRYEILKKGTGIDTHVEKFLDSVKFCNEYIKQLQESSKKEEKLSFRDAIIDFGIQIHLPRPFYKKRSDNE